MPANSVTKNNVKEVGRPSMPRAFPASRSILATIIAPVPLNCCFLGIRNRIRALADEREYHAPIRWAIITIGYSLVWHKRYADFEANMASYVAVDNEVDVSLPAGFGWRL